MTSRRRQDAKIELYAIVKSTPLESNKNHPRRSPPNHAGGWRAVFPATASRDPAPLMRGVARGSESVWKQRLCKTTAYAASVVRPKTALLGNRSHIMLLEISNPLIY